ncbi:MAG: AMP-binding protein, partial [Planctomycetes bacterium]|nr:AMP-binding protein [Planctomycetota bacterium]
MPAPSYAHGVSDRPLLGETIGGCLRRVAREHPDNEVLVSMPQHLRFTYRQFDQLVDRAAKAFLRLGIARGDRVALWSVNNYEWVVAQFATARIGAVLVNVNPAYRTHEFEYVLKESRAKALLLLEPFKHSDYPAMFYEVCPEAKDCEPGHLDSWRFPELESVISIGEVQHPGMLNRRSFGELGEEADDATLARIEAEVDCDDIINIQYTSGTTGFPKGVLLTHHNILNNARSCAEVLELGPSDRLCVPVPFYHCFGMVVSVLGAVTAGTTIVIPSPTFDAGATLHAVERERCTVLHGVPTMFVAELEHPEFAAFDLTSLRTGIMAGAPCPVELMKKVIDRMHMARVLIGYGQTETSPVTTMTRPDDPVELRVRTVGRVMPHQEVKVVDPATGRTVPRRTPGELCFPGYMLMAVYDRNPEATRQTIEPNAFTAACGMFCTSAALATSA